MRSEAVVLVVDPVSGAVVGTLDVESAAPDAFTKVDRRALRGCAAALSGLVVEAGSQVAVCVRG
jgi:putative methionine-R-sulfoxide reductase with GAF domain